MRKVALSVAALLFVTVAATGQKEDEDAVVRAVIPLLTSYQGHALGPLTHGCNFQSISIGQTRFGALDTSSCFLSGPNVYADFWRFTANAADRVRVTITTTSSAMNPLFGSIQGPLPAGTVLASDARSSPLVIEHTLPATAEYAIGVSTLNSFTTGPYSVSLALVAQPPPPPPPPPSTCVITTTSACLAAGRFRVSVTWRAPTQGTSGTGTASHLTGDTAYFWFFNSANVELVVKVLDGRAINGRFWVFYGALSNVEYTINVTDTLSGTVKTYINPNGTLASVADTMAF